MFPQIPKELVLKNSDLVSKEPTTEDDALDWYNTARGEAINAVLLKFKAEYPVYAEVFTEFEEFLEHNEDEAAYFAPMSSLPQESRPRERVLRVAITLERSTGSRYVTSLEGDEAVKWERYIDQVTTYLHEHGAYPPFDKLRWFNKEIASK